MKIYFNLNFDNSSCQKAATVIYSILQNIPEVYSPQFYILHFDISIFNRFRLNLLIKRLRRNANIKFFKLNISDFFFPIEENSPITPEAYLRIVAPQNLPDDVDRMLYLDIDTLVVSDLSELFTLDIKSKIIAACTGWCEPERKTMLGLDVCDSYFNSGVMLINIPLWKKYDISERTLRYINDYGKPLPRWDQDALNHVLKQKWEKLPGIYNTRFCGNINFTPDLYKYLYNIIMGNDESLKKDMLSQLLCPKIIHYTGWGQCKPWFKNSLASNSIFYRTIYNKIPFFFARAGEYHGDIVN